jgi:diguanylate cyclase (GGDEF)-like protein
MREQDELDLLALRVAAAAGSRPAESAADVFAVEERVARHLLARLLGDEPTEKSVVLDQASATAQHPYVQPEHGRLRLADALVAAERKDWDEVTVQTTTAILLFGDAVGAPVIAMTLRLATLAEVAKRSGGAVSGLTYWSARRRRDARLQLLSAARAGLETEQLRVERDEHARQAHVDELTGLANRRGYSRHTALLRARASAGPTAALVVDVDAFKAVNDTFGHVVGDAVLVRVAQVLSTGIRQADLVARLGGDEFVVVLDGVDADSARRRASDISRRLARIDWSVLAPGLDVTISIGVAAGQSSDPQAFLERADQALYRSKSRGGGTITLSAS